MTHPFARVLVFAPPHILTSSVSSYVRTLYTLPFLIFSPPSPTLLFVSHKAQLDQTGTPGNTAVADVSKTGAFVRKDAIFRNRIELGGEFPPEADRYHLYFSYACPWASRCLAFIELKGLDHIITTSSVHPTWQKTRPDDPNVGFTTKNTNTTQHSVTILYEGNTW